MTDSDLLERGQVYARLRGVQLNGTGFLGAGQDGTVWRTPADSAIKVFHREGAFACELAAYQRLAELDMAQVNEFVIPRVIDFDDNLQVIEMDIVSPPTSSTLASATSTASRTFRRRCGSSGRRIMRSWGRDAGRSCGGWFGSWRSTASITSTRGREMCGLGMGEMRPEMRHERRDRGSRLFSPLQRLLSRSAAVTCCGRG